MTKTTAGPLKAGGVWEEARCGIHHRHSPRVRPPPSPLPSCRDTARWRQLTWGSTASPTSSSDAKTQQLDPPAAPEGSTDWTRDRNWLTQVHHPTRPSQAGWKQNPHTRIHRASHGVSDSNWIDFWFLFIFQCFSSSLKGVGEHQSLPDPFPWLMLHSWRAGKWENPQNSQWELYQ